MSQHDWIPSRLGHGETMCRRCFITNREAAALGEMHCSIPPKNSEAQDTPPSGQGHIERGGSTDDAGVLSEHQAHPVNDNATR